MTYNDQDILEDFYEGNSKTIKVTVYDEDHNLKSLVGAEITYVITDRKDYDIVHLRKRSYKGDTEIKVTGIGLCEVYINPPDTIDLHGTFIHHLNVVDINGKEATIFTGRVVIHETSGKRYREVGLNAYLEGTLV